MTKKNDDLKIDINEIFGGDLPSPSEALDAPVTSAPPVAGVEAEAPAAPVAETQPAQAVAAAEAEKNFQVWMATRNQELEMKALELERRLKELQAQQSPVESNDSLSGQALQSAVVEERSAPPPPPPQAPPPSDSPIDFDAPMAPPFMGAAASATEDAPPAAEAEAMDPQKAEELRKLQAEHEFFMHYDEYRNIIAHELTQLVGEKKTNTMLERTVELAREKYPEVFRNANWDAAGNLIENGSIDSQRVIDNKNAMDPQKADAVVDVALSALLNLRLQAVEKGLGAGLKNKVRARMYQWINEKIQKAVKEGKDPASLRRLSGYIA